MEAKENKRRGSRAELIYFAYFITDLHKKFQRDFYGIAKTTFSSIAKYSSMNASD